MLTAPPPGETTRERDPQLGLVPRLERVYDGLMAMRRPMEGNWRTIAQFYAPHLPRFMVEQTDEGGELNSNIVNPIGSLSVEIATSGLLQGTASPSRPWFQGATVDRALMDQPGVPEWLSEWEKAILSIMERSNFYTAASGVIRSALLFGTGAMLMLEDPDAVVRYVDLAIGSYAIGQDDRGKVDTLARKLTMTVRQVVEKFGYDKCSDRIKDSYRNRDYQRKVEVRHLIAKNAGYMRDAIGPAGKKWIEHYWEGRSEQQSTGYTEPPRSGGHDEKPLKVGGYNDRPFAALRWDKQANDTYGTTWPCLTALPDVRMLQTMDQDLLDALSQELTPPLRADPSLRNEPISLDDKEISWAAEGQVGPLHVNTILRAAQFVQDKISRTEARVEATLFVTLFRQFVNDERADRETARGIDAREREKLAGLAPILERFSDDFYAPVVDRTSNIAVRRSQAAWKLELGLRAGGQLAEGQRVQGAILPFPPEALSGATIRIEHVSEVAQAQKLIGLSGMDRFLGTVASMAEWKPSVLDNINADAVVRHYREKLSVEPSAVYDEEQVGASREEQARMQAAQQAQAALPGMAKAAKDLSQTQVGQPGTALAAAASEDAA